MAPTRGRGGPAGKPLAALVGLVVPGAVALAASGAADSFGGAAPHPERADRPGDLAPARAPIHAYLDGPPPGHTGGFGEPTCQRCHFDAAENPPEAELEVRGFPDRFVPDSSYGLTIVLTSPHLGRAGFEAAVRCSEGQRAGEQAGRLSTADDRVEMVRGGGDELTGDSTVLYARHTGEGSRTTATDTAAWALTWTSPGGASAPAAAAGARGGTGGGPASRPCPSVVLHAAANAANGDASEFGDRVLSASWSAARRAAGGGR